MATACCIGSHQRLSINWMVNRLSHCGINAGGAIPLRRTLLKSTRETNTGADSDENLIGPRARCTLYKNLLQIGTYFQKAFTSRNLEQAAFASPSSSPALFS